MNSRDQQTPNKVSVEGERRITAEFVASEEFERFIKNNVNYYRYQFENFCNTNAGASFVSFRSWNWPAAILGSLWFAYRKMYMRTAQVLWWGTIFPFLIAVYVTKSDIVGYLLYLGVVAYCGIYANGQYLDHIDTKHRVANSPLHFSLIGGTSIWGALITLLIIFILLAIEFASLI